MPQGDFRAAVAFYPALCSDQREAASWTSNIPLLVLFGAADVSSSDGQHFPTAGPGEAVGAVNAHYERTASALFYTHLSARQAPYHTIAIPPSGEAAYVIDGLLYHEADLSIATHHTDGGGVSDHTLRSGISALMSVSGGASHAKNGDADLSSAGAPGHVMFIRRRMAQSTKLRYPCS